MKIKKFLMISLPILAPVLLALFTVSCSPSTNEEQIKIDQTKSNLDKFIDDNLNQIMDEQNIKLFNESYITNINLFNALMDNSLISQNFYFDDSSINIDNQNAIINFDFYYDNQDSYGQILKPSLSADLNSIEIPILVSYYDLNLKTQVCKYIKLFSVSIVESIVNDEQDNGYNGQKGKTIVFQNKNFQTIPTIMIDKYLDFVSMINEPQQEYRKYPIYQNQSSQLQDWEGKTLSEVKNNISDAIKNPSDFIYNKNQYYYSIQNQYFYGEGDWHYAYFLIDIQLRPNENVSLINDAKNIYGLKFDKVYAIVDKRWAFHEPSSDDIKNYVSNNDKICSEFINIPKNNVLLYTPTININPSLINDKHYKAADFVRRFERGIKNDFIAPDSFVGMSSNEEFRTVSFSIESLEVADSNENRIKINLKMNVDKGELMASKDFSKTFDLESWKFV